MSGMEALCGMIGVVMTQICTVLGLWLQSRSQHDTNVQRLTSIIESFNSHMDVYHGGKNEEE